MHNNRFNEAAGADPADAAATTASSPSSRRFNEAAGADPADAPPKDASRAGHAPASMRPRGQTPRMLLDRVDEEPEVVRFNEAAGADPADALCLLLLLLLQPGFNEAAGADPADARRGEAARGQPDSASMRPRGQTPRMPLKSELGLRPIYHQLQ